VGGSYLKRSFSIESFKKKLSRQEYNVYRRTLCPDSSELSNSVNSSPNFVVDISTSSEDDVQFTIQVSVEDEFHVGYSTLAIAIETPVPGL